VAPFKVRLKRVMENFQLNQEDAKREMDRFDKSSREFIKRYFKAEMEDPVHYDVVINTERLSFPAAASLVVNATLPKASLKQINQTGAVRRIAHRSVPMSLSKDERPGENPSPGSLPYAGSSKRETLAGREKKVLRNFPGMVSRGRGRRLFLRAIHFFPFQGTGFLA